VVVFPEPEAALGKLWNQSRPMLQLLATEVLLVSILAWFAVASALRPTRQMLGCLAQMAQGDLAIRLPPARITELNSIVHAVNHLSSKLHATLLERAALAHRLVDAHESERRNLARELHDELAQCLSAINAKAALIALHAARSAPIVISQAKSIGEVATSTLGQLRDTLVRLRPPEIDELGLIESLERMVRCWGRNHPEIECRFEASGCFDAVPMPASVSLYRIVQECLTNVARHADASHVTVMLGRSPKGPLDLQVLDDGCGMAPAEPQSGLGVVGMRERVAALQGRIRFASGRSKGFTVHVTLPTEYESPLTAVDARAVGT
jgi:signal transduction histidine kinase